MHIASMHCKRLLSSKAIETFLFVNLIDGQARRVHFCLKNKPREYFPQSAVRYFVSTVKATATQNFQIEMDKIQRLKGQGAGLSKSKKNKNIKRVPPNSVNLVVIGTGGPGTSKSLLVTTEYSRYLFNCGEGTQRLGSINKEMRGSVYAKLTGLEHIFITHKSWENTGGLLGLAMVMEGQKNPESKNFRNRDQSTFSVESTPQITLYGPEGVENITRMAKKFAQQMNLRVERSEEMFEDEAITITPIILNAEGSQHLSSSCDDDREDFEPASKKQCQGLQSTPSQDVYAYICQTRPPIPKINIEKCMEAGVTVGPMIGELQRGKVVTLDDGRVVHPHQVTDVMNQDNRPFLILECPSESYLSSLESHQHLTKYMNSDDAASSFSLVVHMTCAEVFNSERYQAWMKKLSHKTSHLVMNSESYEAEILRVLEHQTRLNLISSEIFPALPAISVSATNFSELNNSLEGNNDNSVQSSNGTDDGSGKAEAWERRVVKASPGLVYGFRGKQFGFQSFLPEWDSNVIREDVLNNSEISSELDKLRLQSQAETQSSDTDTITNYPRVTFLGTGSSEPNKIRSQSCIVVQLSKHTAVILDCGEDSYGQLYRFCGSAKSRKILEKVKAIFVSHMHGDHHMGLFSFLKERKKVFDDKNIPYEPVLLMAPVQIMRWLYFYHNEVEPLTHLVRFLPHQRDSTVTGKLFSESATVEEAMSQLKLTQYEPVEVIHCKNSYGIALTHMNGFKLVYSGDTRPCDKLIEAGKNCDLLIHEATHEDALIKHAEVSRHTTFSEAMEVGKKMKAKHIILTHFSQRYAHMVPLNNLDVPDNVGVAFDNMQVCPATLNHLPKMLPALTAMFAEELQEIGLKTIKRKRAEEES